jgi:membrane carboxypeptidase/penicillin-binding protein
VAFISRNDLEFQNSKYYDNGYEADITVLPGWKEADETVKAEIIEVAKTYIYKRPENNIWLGKESISYSALAGYRSIRSIAAIDLDFISSKSLLISEMDVNCIYYPNVNDDKNKQVRCVNNQASVSKCISGFIEILMILIDKENNLDRQLGIHQQAIDCWDNKLEKAFLEKLSDDALTASSLGSLLQILLQNRADQARLF